MGKRPKYINGAKLFVPILKGEDGKHYACIQITDDEERDVATMRFESRADMIEFGNFLLERAALIAIKNALSGASDEG